MKVFSDLNDLPEFKKPVVTIGSFDGVHRGHQKIIEKVNGLAEEIGGESVLITFHPHPRLILYPDDDSLRLITTIDEKVKLLERYGLDNVVVIPFTQDFSQQSADEYIENFLVDKFSPRYIVIGYDHRFGQDRQGDVEYLRGYGERYHYSVVEIEKQEVRDIAVSSTKIRKALEAGEIRTANHLMGHPFMITGTVVRGNRIGTKLGFPTANLELSKSHKLIPPNGIYAVFTNHHERRYGGMLYIGDRPSLKQFHDQTIEVNIFGFDKDIYGDTLSLELIDFLRMDQEYEQLEDLGRQLEIDRQEAQKVLEQETARSAQKKSVEPPAVAIVILNYNRREHLKRFLPSVMASNYPGLQIVIADNASEDGSVAFLKAEYPELPVIELPENYGYAGGYNRALSQIEAEYYLLLNSDVEVLPDWIDPLIEVFRSDASVAAAQPKVRSFTRKTFFEYAGAAGGWIDYLGYPFCRGRIFSVTERDMGQYDSTEEIFWASGAAFLIKSHLFHGIGGFDEDYFAHAEEIDLCWRLKRGGYKIMAVPDSVVYHLGGGTLEYNSPRKAYLNFRNTLYTIFKNEPVSKLLWLIPARLFLDGLAGLLFLMQGKFKHIFSIFRAHWTFFPSLPRTWKKRRAYEELIQKVSIHPEPNLRGQLQGSIVWRFYARGRKSFKQL
ncbi:MAG: bifunctional riboflavin kinase/FAD synthetase [Saprospiraceae bacterium]|nr:bifunctional riboflavin kinase/FAD synthetase [Saprospiraceae bacterium]